MKVTKEKYREIGVEVLTRKIKERVKKITDSIIENLDNKEIKEHIYNVVQKSLDVIDNAPELECDPAVKAMILDDVVKDNGLHITKSILKSIDEDYKATLNDMEYQAKRLKHVDDRIKNPSLMEGELPDNINPCLKEFFNNHIGSA